MANSVEGTFYLHSIDASREDKTTQYVADGLEKVMKEIGTSNVIQICSDNASNYVLAHVMDLVLEGIGKIPRFKDIIRGAQKITTHVCNHGTLHSKWCEASKNKELVRCG